MKIPYCDECGKKIEQNKAIPACIEVQKGNMASVIFFYKDKCEGDYCVDCFIKSLQRYQETGQVG